MPLIENVSILRNILYSGIWIRFNIKNEKRNPSMKKDENEREHA